MLKWMRKRLSDDSGFTLIELMVVVLIIAVLVAIAIPSFIGFRNRAQDRAAQSELRNVLLAEQAVWTDTGAYTAVEATLKTYEPSIDLGLAAVAVEATVFVAAPEDVVCLERVSASGTTFGVWVSDVDGTFYGATAIATCNGSSPAGYSQGGW